jgi:hypothetical protein
VFAPVTEPGKAKKRYATTMVTKAVKITLTTGDLLRKQHE